MSSSVSIARYLLDEASSGTTPTECADDTGNGNTLTINYNTSDANWTSNGAGNGFEVTATVDTSPAGSFLNDIVNNGNVGSSYGSVTELSSIVVIGIDNGGDSISRVFCVTQGTSNGDFAICINDFEQIIIRWDNGGDMVFPAITGDTTVAVVVDTTQVTAADRVNVHYDGNATPETLSSGSYPAQNTALTSINSTDRGIGILNRPAGSRNPDGRCFYAELFTGQLTTTEISDSHTALSSDNDSDWAGGAPITDISIFRRRLEG